MSRKDKMMQAAQRLADTKRTETAKQQCLYDFEIAVDWADNNPDWISVDDELPTEHRLYLFRFNDGTMRVEVYYPDLRLSKTVTHWMNLPKPPTQ